jgi:hypothetical protein
MADVVVPLRVQVWPITLPARPPLKISMNVNQHAIAVLYPEMDDSTYGAGTAMQKKWFDFMAAYHIPPNGQAGSGSLLPLEDYKLMAEAGADPLFVADVSRMNCSGGAPCRGNPSEKDTPSWPRSWANFSLL